MMGIMAEMLIERSTNILTEFQDCPKYLHRISENIRKASLMLYGALNTSLQDT